MEVRDFEALARRAAELRIGEASRTLDRAFIGTIHAFCAQLLRRRPVEAQVDPAFSELAQPEALRLFNRVFRQWIEQRLSSPSPALRRALTRLARQEDEDGREPLDSIRNAAWNLAEWREYPAPWTRRAFEQAVELNALVLAASTVKSLRDQCDRRYEPLHIGLQPLADFVDRVERSEAAGNRDLDVTESEILRLPGEMRWLKSGSGQYGKGLSRDVVFAAWNDLKDAIEAFRGRADADLAAALRDELWQVVVLYEDAKRRSGELDFADLLLCARRLLMNDHARADLQNQYSRIFVDEFQDTDELQAEILFLLSATDPAERNWRRAAPIPGKLFLVGDPKQSIYRFRRADARLYRRVRADLESQGVQMEELTSNTRSIAPTRARDLLVVATMGEKQFEDRWLSPLYEAIYPPPDRWRVAANAPGCPVIGDSTVLNRPMDQREDSSIRPGLHFPKHGSHEVVWFDPRVLPPSPQERDGLEHEDVLSGTTDQAVMGLNRYLAWKQGREDVVARGKSPTFNVVAARTITDLPAGKHIVVDTVQLPFELPRPSGRRFGALVHDVLQHSDQVGNIEAAAITYGRKHGASVSEIEAAVYTATSALSHPAVAVPPGADRYRELPVMVRDEAGRLIEGNIDLAIFDGTSWIAVDYKTDRRSSRNPAQLQAYCLALERATGKPVRGVLFEI